MGIPTINANEVNAWLEAAKAEGGFHQVRVTGAIPYANDPSQIKKAGSSPEERAARIGAAMSGGSVIDLNTVGTWTPVASGVDSYDGKRVVNNSNEIFGVTLTVGGDYEFGSGKWAADMSDHGAPLHRFFFEGTDFLTDAAKKYAALGDDETFLYRDINDGGFVKGVLDFFTGGNYTDSDAASMRRQMDAIVEELAQQVKEVGEPDFNKLQNKLTIQGLEVSVTELMEYQKVGRELTDAFREEGTMVDTWQQIGMNAPVWGKRVADYAEMGLARSAAQLYGSERGELGKLFSAGFDRLYEKAMARTEETASKEFWGDDFWSREAVNIQVDAARLFGKLDTSSKESMTADYAKTMNQLQSRILAYCYTNCPNMTGANDRYNPYGTTVDLNGTKARIDSFFQSWLEKIGTGMDA